MRERGDLGRGRLNVVTTIAKIQRVFVIQRWVVPLNH
ncbi:hypothetical protein RB6506 [Rhodopirellula baltica SH 1]|uniref:Uncharacterized protein n=1 Tax=Rhodopirellula baltica (strain DSM 10527 / NCIMB 13988 / SH1) TaxID=243090 RepID=Q7UQ55_RHOBA|nr:hypothetical protein RB6506 [Rhodopirellula baltica SH 1]